MIKDYFRMAVRTITNRGVRSWLTMLGIFVGIAAVVALISVGQGLQTAISQQFEELGTDILFIQPRGAGFVPSGEENPVKITEQDEDEVAKVNGVLQTATMVFRSGRVEFKDDVNFQFITGVPVDDPDEYDLVQRMFTIDVLEGRNLQSGDKNKAVVGNLYSVEDEIFSQPIRVGDRITVEDQRFDVVGIMEKTGSPPDDGQVVIPLDVADDILGVSGDRGSRTRDYIVAQIDPSLDPEAAAEDVKRQLMNFRDLDEGEEDFTIQTADQLLGSFNIILAVVQAVLIGIAAISLLVGGIGITNTMYTAVLERTKDIGVMKAIGARNSDILLLFWIESGLIGLVGGVIGVILGYGISATVTSVMASYLASSNITTFFPWWLVAGALLFSFLVGAISGTLPARQASRMNPVDALRYE